MGPFSQLYFLEIKKGIGTTNQGQCSASYLEIHTGDKVVVLELRVSYRRTGLPCGVRSLLYKFSECTSLFPWVTVSLVLILRKRRALCFELLSPHPIISREVSVAGMNGGLHSSFCSEKTALFVCCKVHICVSSQYIL